MKNVKIVDSKEGEETLIQNNKIKLISGYDEAY